MKMIKTSAVLALLTSLVAGCGVYIDPVPSTSADAPIDNDAGDMIRTDELTKFIASSVHSS